MDTKLIQQYGEDILCYRLRTARQKKRLQYEDFDKQLIQLHKEERALIKLERSLGWETLNPPVQKGWKRFFVLRDDVARSKQAEFFEKILQKINTYDWSYRKDFKIKKRRFGKKGYIVKPQSLLRLFEDDIKRLSFSEKELQYFTESWELDWKKQPIKRYVFNESWRFVLRTRPNMIEKIRKRDEVIERRFSEIDNYLDRNQYRIRQTKIVCGSVGWRFDETERIWERNPLKNKTLQEILDNINDQLLSE